LLVALDGGADLGSLSGAKTAFAQALAGEGGKRVIGDATWLANGVRES
jgi:hypothetical protein